jgi:hypothetical protein
MNKIDETLIPNPKNHLITSVIKSVLRIVGLLVLFSAIPLGILLLIIAELVGLVEELV